MRRVADPLIQALKDNESNVRGHAAEALGEINDTSAIGSMFQVLLDDQNQVRYSVGRALVKLGKPAVDPLIDALKVNQAIVREIAATALGEINDTKANGPLIQALGDENGDVRASAALSLAQINGMSSAEIAEDPAWDFLISSLCKWQSNYIQ